MWFNALNFASTISEDRQLIEPLHLALVSLYQDLKDSYDPRLIGAPVVKTLERPLFWIAISQAAKSHFPDSLVQHIQATTYKDDTELSLPISIGQAMWLRVQELPDLIPVDYEEINDTNMILEGCTEQTRTVLVKANTIRARHRDKFIAPHHVLLALLENEHISAIIADHDVSVDAIADVIRKLRSKPVTDPDSKPRFELLNEFATDVTKLAEEGVIGPVIGRTREIRRLIAILSRLSKNNAVLLGDPGVGKTAIAEGLALRIVQGEVPESVCTRVFSLDLGAILATTACKSSYEIVLEAILQEIADHEERGINVILFIDDLSQITLGGYRDSGVGIDAATLMKPYLGKGKLRCVGCSTFEDYGSSVEKDGALARNFSPVFVCEPTVTETMEVLRGLKDVLQNYHGVQILDESFVAAASIAAQFFTHKRLPDAAIDLVDEACVIVKIGKSENWEQLGVLKRRKVAIEIDIRSLERSVDENNDEELEGARSRLWQIEQQISRLTSSNLANRIGRTKVEDLDKKIEELEQEMAKYGQAGEREERAKCLTKVFELRAKRQEEEKQALESRRDSLPDDESLPAAEISRDKTQPVSKQTVIQAASWRTFIPSAGPHKLPKRIGVSESLSNVVVGQTEAVEEVSAALRCVMSGLTDPARPVASFLFGGRSGSGKALLAMKTAGFLPESSGKPVRINGNDYAEPHSISRLIGTPACTGFDQGGELTECVRRRPFSVVYIRDIEKGCSDFRLHIQTILDEGLLRDGAGKVVDFRNCIIIITTSVGQDTLRYSLLEEDERKHFVKEIQKWFPEEFLARLDRLVVFNPMSKDKMSIVIDTRMEETRKQLSQVKLHLEIEDSAKEDLAKRGWSPTLGVRPLERIIRSEILQPLATLLLEDRIGGDWTVVVSSHKQRLYIKPVKLPRDQVRTNVVRKTSRASTPSSTDVIHGFGEAGVGESTSPGSPPSAEREDYRTTSFGSIPGPPKLQLLPQRLFF